MTTFFNLTRYTDIAFISEVLHVKKDGRSDQASSTGRANAAFRQGADRGGRRSRGGTANGTHLEGRA